MIAKKKARAKVSRRPAPRRPIRKAATRRATVRSKGFVFPKIGAAILGGIFAGIVAGVDGAEDYALIVGRDLGEGTWSYINERANALDDDGASWDVGSRNDWSVCKANVPHLFEKTWYWTNEQHASGSYGAWGQGFGNGNQDRWGKHDKLRGRAVRRSPISQFIHFLQQQRAA